MVVNDLISNTILSSGSMFFPGFTVSAFISGVIAGMFLYNQKITWRRIFIYEFFQILITNVIFTTLWLYLMSLSSSSTHGPHDDSVAKGSHYLAARGDYCFDSFAAG